MGVIRGLISGFALAGIVTFAYEQQIYNTSSYLRTALNSLSKDLDALRIKSQVDEIPQEPVGLEKLPVSEQIKVQWNEQLLRGMNGLYTTNWPEVASKAWTAAKNEASTLSKRLSS